MHTYMHPWNIHRSDHGTQNLNFIHRVYRQGLPSISADLPSIGHLTGLGPFNQWLLTYNVQQDHKHVSSTECNSKTLTAFYSTRSLCTANIKGANIYKNVKCTDSWRLSSQHSSQILALVQKPQSISSF
jgi:hypothetical protein